MKKHTTKKQSAPSKKKPAKRKATRALAIRDTVDFIGKRPDLHCVLLGMLGFSSKHIERETGYEPTQVRYRFKLAGVKLSNYQEGTSKIARAVQTGAELQFGDFLATQLSGPGRKVIHHQGRLFLQ